MMCKDSNRNETFATPTHPLCLQQGIQRPQIGVREDLEVGAHVFGLPVPPGKLLKLGDHLLREATLHFAGRASRHHGVGGDVAGHDGTAADAGSVADGDTGHDQRLVADPHIVSDHDIPLVVPSGLDRKLVLEELGEDGERKVREGGGLVVSPIEEETCPRSDGAVPPDSQPVMVHVRVVVEDVLALEGACVLEVVVVGEVPHFDEGRSDDILQEHRQLIPRARKGDAWIKGFHGISFVAVIANF